MPTIQEAAAFTLKPLPAPLGAEITGIDLSKPIDGGTRKALHDAWVKHAVLVIRGQKLSPEQFAQAAGIFGELLEQQVETGALVPPLDIDTLAYLMARIAESFLYTNVITGDEPDPVKAGQAIRVLLSAPAVAD